MLAHEQVNQAAQSVLALQAANIAVAVTDAVYVQVPPPTAVEVPPPPTAPAEVPPPVPPPPPPPLGGAPAV